MTDAAVNTSIRALVLSRAHRCLLVPADGGWRVPELIGPPPALPLAALRQHVRDTLGITLPSPAGSFVPADGRGPRDFLFVIDPPPAPSGSPFTWAPLPRALEMTASTGHDRWIWQTYVDRMLGGWEPPTRELDVFYFGAPGEMAARLAHLVTCGDKRGTGCWVRAAQIDGEPAMKPGMISIVTDGFGYARCAIETVDDRSVRFAEVDETMAALEGEGDLTLSYWREVHLAYFRREAEERKIAFGEDEEISVVRFRVLHVIGRRDEALPRST